MFEDFLNATDGHSRIINFCTQPNWLFKQTHPHIYPDNVTLTDWSYQTGIELIDNTMKDLGDYYGRLVAWYTRGGFIDEYGLKHNAGYEFNWDYTEIFNEINSENHMNLEFYTKTYDAVIQGSRSRTDPKEWEAFFGQLDGFILSVEKIEEVRKNLSPSTRTTIGELGVILADDSFPSAPQLPLIYWNAAATLYAYSWLKLSRLAIDIVGHSQLVGYPELHDLQLQPQFPSVALLNWTTGQGSAKYWTSKLPTETVDIDNDQAVITQTTDVTGQNISCQAFVGKNDRGWILIINKRYYNIDISLPGCSVGQMQIIKINDEKKVKFVNHRLQLIRGILKTSSTQNLR